MVAEGSEGNQLVATVYKGVLYDTELPTENSQIGNKELKELHQMQNPMEISDNKIIEV